MNFLSKKTRSLSLLNKVSHRAHMYSAIVDDEAIYTHGAGSITLQLSLTLLFVMKQHFLFECNFHVDYLETF